MLPFSAVAWSGHLLRIFAESFGSALSERTRPSLDASISSGGWVHDVLRPAAIQRSDDAGYRVSGDRLDEGVRPAKAMGGRDHSFHGQKRVVGIGRLFLENV